MKASRAALVVGLAVAGCYSSHERTNECPAAPGVCCGGVICAPATEICLLVCGSMAIEPQCVASTFLSFGDCMAPVVTAACDGPEDCTGGNVCTVSAADTFAATRCMTLDLPPTGASLCHASADCYAGSTCDPASGALAPYMVCSF